MESPSHPGLWATVRQSGLTLAGCPVDAHGLQTARLPALGADAVVVSPAHQFPTGAVMTPARRTALIQWAARTRGLTVEDDYDAEFRYDRTPIGAVQGLDPRRVAHVGTTAKTFAAGMQLLLPLPGQTDDTALAEAAAARGIGITALSPLHLARSPDRGLLLGFGRLPEHKITLAVDALWTVLNEAGAAPSPGRPRHAHR